MSLPVIRRVSGKLAFPVFALLLLLGKRRNAARLAHGIAEQVASIRFLRPFAAGRMVELCPIDLRLADPLEIPVERRGGNPHRIRLAPRYCDDGESMRLQEIIGRFAVLKDIGGVIEVVGAGEPSRVEQRLGLCSPGAICGKNDFLVDRPGSVTGRLIGVVDRGHRRVGWRLGPGGRGRDLYRCSPRGQNQSR